MSDTVLNNDHEKTIFEPRSLSRPAPAGQSQYASGGSASMRRISTLAAWLLVLAGCTDSHREAEPASAPPPPGRSLPAVDADRSAPAELRIVCPLDESLFPPDMAAPTFRWDDSRAASDTWRIVFRFSDGEAPLEFRSPATEWTVPDDGWQVIKQRSREGEATVTVSGVRQSAPQVIMSQGSVRIRTSNDEVGAPLFFREVNLPFITAVKNPAAYIRWRFGPISSKEPPPIVLDKLPVCGNCHSFSADGSVLGMDVDYANDKGSYAMASVAKEMALTEDEIITWSDYRREDGDPTFGLLSQVSPDGRYVVGTVKDRSVFVATDDLAFSQLFFPFKGILAVYDRQTRKFAPLPGADDPQFVQSNPNWSPDGKSIVFARSKAYELKKLLSKDKVLLSSDECEEFLKNGKTFRFDLYRIPFNEGRGGPAEPIDGASRNGMSNYFGRFSPDGKWIVFCKANSFMLLQPDSELYIIPSQGGEARRLRCNTTRMNSWHSWSPNGRWLVFSSKMYSLYTQLFLTHIDENGESSVPVVLSRFTEAQRAANIPEFVNVAPDGIRSISAAFLDDHSYFRAAEEFFRQADPLGALPLYEKAVEVNPKHVGSRFRLATILMDLARFGEAKAHLEKILEHEPRHSGAHHHLAVLASREGKPQEAAAHCRQALEIDPDFFTAHMTLALILAGTGDFGEAETHLAEAVRLTPADPHANYYYGYVLHRQGKLQEAAKYYASSVELDSESVPSLLALAVIRCMPQLADFYNPQEAIPLAEKACRMTDRKVPDVLKILASVYSAAGRNRDALATATEALQTARAQGDESLARQIEKDLAVFQQAARAEKTSGQKD